MYMYLTLTHMDPGQKKVFEWRIHVQFFLCVIHTHTYQLSQFLSIIQIFGFQSQAPDFCTKNPEKSLCAVWYLSRSLLEAINKWWDLSSDLLILVCWKPSFPRVNQYTMHSSIWIIFIFWWYFSFDLKYMIIVDPLNIQGNLVWDPDIYSWGLGK